jgi:small subunit ribosomal protein S8
MVNDPIGDMISQIKNACLAGNDTVTLPFSKMKLSVAEIMRNEGYLSEVQKGGSAPKFTLKLTLRYQGRKSVVSDLKRRSKPGLRVYVKRYAIPHVVGGMGTAIISTPQGVMTDKEARKRGLGGELICELW